MSHERWKPPRVAMRSSKRSSRAILGRLSHGRRLARVAGRGTVSVPARTPCNGRAVAGFCEAMDTDSSLIDPLIDSCDRPRRIVRGARAGTPGPHLLDRAAGPRRPARRRGGRAGRVRPGVPGARRIRPARIRDLRLRPWLATIVLNLCRSRLTRRPPAARADPVARPRASRRARAADRRRPRPGGDERRQRRAARSGRSSC